MALLTSTTLIRTLSLFHLTLSYLFLTSPHTIADQSLVFILGEAMGLPPAPTLSHPSASTALLSAVLALSALSDLTAISLPAESSTHYWGAQAPVRLLFYFAVLGYTYLFKPGGFLAGKGEGRGWGDELKNGVVFTWAFLEMLVWFWVYVTLREERREKVVRGLEKRKAEEEML